MQMYLCRAPALLCALFILIFALDTRPSSAMEWGPQRLTEADIEKVILLIRDDIDSKMSITGWAQASLDRPEMLRAEIRSGKTDPLEWLRERGGNPVIPEGAVYAPGCSRTLSDGANPQAIFHFGRDFPAANRHLLGADWESYKGFNSNPVNAKDPSYKEMKGVEEKIRSYYVSKKFKFDSRSDAYSRPGGKVQVRVKLLETLYYDPVFREGCASLPMGPHITISLEPSELQNYFQGKELQTREDANARFAKSLKAARLTEHQYGAIVAALVRAYDDSQNPAGLEPQETGVHSSLDASMRGVLERLDAEQKTRVSNVALYERYADRLDFFIEHLRKNRWY